MFRRVITYAARGGEDEDGRGAPKKMEKAKRAEIHPAMAIDGTGKTDRAGGYGRLQITLSVHGGKTGQINGHAGFFFKASKERSLSSRTIVLVRMPSPSTSISMTSF